MRGYFDAHGDELSIQQAAIEAAQHRDDFLADHDEVEETRLESQRYRAGYSRGYQAFKDGQHCNPFCCDTESANFKGWSDGHENARLEGVMQ